VKSQPVSVLQLKIKPINIEHVKSVENILIKELVKKKRRKRPQRLKRRNLKQPER